MPLGIIPFPFGKCRICQDKATGLHYGVATCEGCKGFFKRSTLRGSKYKCYFGGGCEITPKNRNRCKSCRYKRCQDVGMALDAVRMGRIPKVEKEKVLEVFHQCGSDYNKLEVSAQKTDDGSYDFMTKPTEPTIDSSGTLLNLSANNEGSPIQSTSTVETSLPVPDENTNVHDEVDDSLRGFSGMTTGTSYTDIGSSGRDRKPMTFHERENTAISFNHGTGFQFMDKHRHFGNADGNFQSKSKSMIYRSETVSFAQSEAHGKPSDSLSMTQFSQRANNNENLDKLYNKNDLHNTTLSMTAADSVKLERSLDHQPQDNQFQLTEALNLILDSAANTRQQTSTVEFSPWARAGQSASTSFHKIQLPQESTAGFSDLNPSNFAHRNMVHDRMKEYVQAHTTQGQTLPLNLSAIVRSDKPSQKQWPHTAPYPGQAPTTQGQTLPLNLSAIMRSDKPCQKQWPHTAPFPGDSVYTVTHDNNWLPDNYAATSQNMHPHHSLHPSIHSSKLISYNNENNMLIHQPTYISRQVTSNNDRSNIQHGMFEDAGKWQKDIDEGYNAAFQQKPRNCSFKQAAVTRVLSESEDMKSEEKIDIVVEELRHETQSYMEAEHSTSHAAQPTSMELTSDSDISYKGTGSISSRSSSSSKLNQSVLKIFSEVITEPAARERLTDRLKQILSTKDKAYIDSVVNVVRNELQNILSQLSSSHKPQQILENSPDWNANRRSDNAEMIESKKRTLRRFLDDIEEFSVEIKLTDEQKSPTERGFENVETSSNEMFNATGRKTDLSGSSGYQSGNSEEIEQWLVSLNLAMKILYRLKPEHRDKLKLFRMGRIHIRVMTDSDKDVEFVYDRIITSIPLLNERVLGFCENVPMFSDLNKDDKGKLIKRAFYDIWMLTYSEYFRDRKSEMILTTGEIYSIEAMRKILNDVIVDTILDFSEQFNALELSDLEISILCAVRLSYADELELEDRQTVEQIHTNMFNTLRYELEKNHPCDHIQLFNSIIKLIPLLEEINRIQKTIIGNFSTKFKKKS